MNNPTPWIHLAAAALLEIVWAIGLKYSEGLTKLWPSVLTVVAMIFSFLFLSSAVRSIPVGTAYAIWTGIGAVGTATLGIILFNEPATAWRVLCLVLVVVGVVGLKVAG